MMSKRIWWIVLLLLVGACTPGAEQPNADEGTTDEVEDTTRDNNDVGGGGYGRLCRCGPLKLVCK